MDGMCAAWVLLLATVTGAAVGAGPLLENGGFEDSEPVRAVPAGDIGFGLWTLGLEKRVPAKWTLNPAYPGEILVVSEGAPQGQHLVRLTANGTRDAHIFQPCPALRGGTWYTVRARVRGGAGGLGFYEYFGDSSIRVGRIVSLQEAGTEWRDVASYYQPPREGFKSASLHIYAVHGSSLDIDGVSIEEATWHQADSEPVVLENAFVRMVFSGGAGLTEFIDRRSGKNHAADSTAPVFLAERGGSRVPAVQVEWIDAHSLLVHFADPAVTAMLRVMVYPHYFTLGVARLTGIGVDRLQLCRLTLDLRESIGQLLNVAWGEGFGACVLALNDRTHSYGGRYSGAALEARAYEEFGIEGAKIAVIGGPQECLLDIIEEVQMEQGLPHLTVDGTWVKRSPGRFYSYLMTHGLTEANVDEVIEFAKGGFGCIEILNWWHSTPTYEVSKHLFPSGLEGLKRCADKIHAAGMHVGLHAMQGMVGWGGVGMHDPYVYPKADPRLYQDRHATLADAVGPESKEIRVAGSLDEWPASGDLFLAGELARYARRTEDTLVECTRGLHGTTKSGQTAGTHVGHLVNCFDLWGHCIYAPDVNSTMMDEICDNLARVFNAVDADMSYFDGGEEIACQPPRWRNQGRIALGVMSRLRRPVVLEGNALYTNLSWHVITRGSPSYDPIYFGRNEYTLRFKGQNPARWGRDLLTGDVGWFAPHTQSPSTDAVTPDEVELLCLKALGGDAPISFQVSAENLYANKRMPEMLRIIRLCDELKRSRTFCDEVRRALMTPMARHQLDVADQGRCSVRPLQFGPPQLVSPDRPEDAQFMVRNPFAAQSPWLRIRARTGLAHHGAADNIVLADFGTGICLKPDGSSSPNLVPSIGASDQTTPDGSACVVYRAENNSGNVSEWCRAGMTFDSALNLLQHRRIGLWLHSDGKGGILNVQLVNTYGYREHYIDLDYTGWAYHELSQPETARYYDYRWPYNMSAVMYRRFLYHEVIGINLCYNALPAGARVECLVGRIEALREYDVLLEDPELEVAGSEVVFPATLKPDEYLEVDWAGACRHFEPNGGLLRLVKPEGKLELAPGEHPVRFSCRPGTSEGTSPQAEITVAVRGDALPNPEMASRTPGPALGRWDVEQAELRLLPGGRRGRRLMHGIHELCGGSTHGVGAFDGNSNAWGVMSTEREPRAVAVVVQHADADLSVNYEDPTALTLETFDALADYTMSDTNQFEKYVLGGGKRLTADGPVREGVSQTFTPSTQEARSGGSCGVYEATNLGKPGGWCAKGKRFTPALDLAGYQAVAFWLHGDGRGETLRFQFRDTAGQYADWLVTIDFSGWRLQVFRTADAKGFDWDKTEYLIFYYNGIPAGTTCTLRFDDVKMISRAAAPPTLTGIAVRINECEAKIPVAVSPGQSLLLDGRRGSCTVWDAGSNPSQTMEPAVRDLVLRPGENRVVLTCDNPGRSIGGVTVRVVPLP